MICPYFDTEQLHMLQQAHDYDEDLGTTLAAISLVESEAGKNVVNEAGRSYGVFQNLLSTVVSRDGRSPVYLKARLINDWEFSARYALEELEYWLDVYEGDLEDAVRSYNAGWEKHYGNGYLELIKKQERMIDKCINL